ncbi:MAG: two-component regulator propeller domain-containing protein [Chitinophagaceae bacterium]
MIKHKISNSLLFPFILFLMTLSACNNGSEEIPFPEKEAGYTQPVTVPLKFTEEKKLSWDTVKKGDIKPVISKLDIDALPSKPFDSTGFKPFTKAPEETHFDYNSLPDTAFDYDKLPSKPIGFKKNILEITTSVKAGPPTWQKNKPISMADFGVPQGLPAKFTSCLFKDKHGLLWIGSDQGIYRYDGDRIETIVSKVSAPVVGMAEDRKGRIWYTHAAGMGMIDMSNGTVFFSNNITSVPNGIAKMTVDEKGLLWVYNFKDSAVSIVDPETLLYKNLYKQGFSPLRLVADMTEDENKNMWISTFRGGVSIIDWKTNKIKYLRKLNGLRSDTTSAITIDKTGKIWVAIIGSESGVEAIDVKAGVIKHYAQLQGLNNNTLALGLTFDDKGQLWKSNFPLLEVLDPYKNRSRIIVNNDGPGDVDISTVQDNFKRMWELTTTGIYIIDQNAETVHPFGETVVTSLMQDELGNIWVATRGGLHIIDLQKKRIRFLSTKNGLGNDFVQSFFIYDHKMMISTNGGINIVDPVRKTIERIGKKEGLANDTCYAVFKDKEKTTWLTGPSNGIDRIDSAKKIIFHTDASRGLSDDNISDIKEDRDGLLWMATFQGGIDVINSKNGTVKYLNNVPGLIEGSNKSLLYDKAGRMWIGTGHGLFIADTKKGTLTSITKKNGLANDQVLSLLEYNGSVIVGTNIGSTIVTASSNTGSTTESDTSANHWKISPLSKTQSLVREQGGSWNTDAITSDGKYLWGDKGITAINEIASNDDSVSTYITGLTVMTQQQHFKNNFSFGEKDTLWTNDTFYVKSRQPSFANYTVHGLKWDTVSGAFNLPTNLQIPYNRNYIQFQFSQVHLSRQDSTFYMYVLEGIDKNWSTPTNYPFSQNYLNLPSGNYTFKVSSKGSNGKWSEPASFSFTITPPWWKTWWAWIIYIFIGFGILSSYIGYRSRRLKNENKVLEEKINVRTQQLQKSIEDLKSTQTQLIQSEKMASLGELTAGIAHEIQNPLNFVNNFSEVSVELANELRDELNKVEIPADKKTNLEDIVEDLILNQEKINFHGKRADSIVKGMLQHSRNTSGQKEPTDINALTDEYLRLSYHGLRAKDKTFNATIKTDFDKSLNAINIVPQDIGRTVLNLFTNAFYSVTEKKSLQANGYEPTVTLTTKRLANKAEIRIKDNGMGIPQRVLDKIFQPFFTTKATGQGTGLGLSLSYDIIKAHNGEIKVDTKEGEGAEFIILLPL